MKWSERVEILQAIHRSKNVVVIRKIVMERNSYFERENALSIFPWTTSFIISVLKIVWFLFKSLLIYIKLYIYVVQGFKLVFSIRLVTKNIILAFFPFYILQRYKLSTLQLEVLWIYLHTSEGHAYISPWFFSCRYIIS